MMIYLLDLLLIINILIVFKAFRDFFAPPFLVGIGMLAASIVATCYYSEWQMNTMLPSSVMAIGGGTLGYTFTALLLKKENTTKLRIKSIPLLNVASTKNEENV